MFKKLLSDKLPSENTADSDPDKLGTGDDKVINKVSSLAMTFKPIDNAALPPRTSVRQLRDVKDIKAEQAAKKRQAKLSEKERDKVKKFGKKFMSKAKDNSSVDCPRFLKTSKLFKQILKSKQKYEISKVQGVSIQKRVWSSQEGSSLLGAGLYKCSDREVCQLMASTVSSKRGARLAATQIDTNRCCKAKDSYPRNSIYTAGNAFHPKDINISFNSIRHRIKNFIYVPSQRAFLCYCPNELVVRGYKVDLITDNWVEVLRMPVYPSMNSIQYCELTDELYGASRGALTIWKMTPLGTGRDLELLPPEKSFKSGLHIGPREWVYHLRIFGYVLCAMMSYKIILFHVESKEILDVIVQHHLTAPISDVFLWFKNMEIGLKDDTIAMVIASKDGSISLISNVNVQTIQIEVGRKKNHPLIYHEFVHKKGDTKILCFQIHAGNQLPHALLTNVKTTTSKTFLHNQRRQVPEAIGCILTTSSSDCYIRCCKLSTGHRMYEISLENEKEIIQNLGLLPKFSSVKSAELDSEKLFWVQTNMSLTIYKLSHIVLSLGKTPSEVTNYWPISCRALPPAPAGRKTSRSIISQQDGSLCMVSTNTGQVLTIAHTITLSDIVIDIDVREDGFVMCVILCNGTIMELDISASPATRLLLKEPEKSSDFACCITTRMISITAVPLYEPPTFVGYEIGNIQILDHKFCRMQPLHAHSCGVKYLTPAYIHEGEDHLLSTGTDGEVILWKITNSIPEDLSAVFLNLEKMAYFKFEKVPPIVKLVKDYLVATTSDGDVKLYKLTPNLSRLVSKSQSQFSSKYSPDDNVFGEEEEDLANDQNADSQKSPEGFISKRDLMRRKMSTKIVKQSKKNENLPFQFDPIELDDNSLPNSRPVGADLSFKGYYIAAAWCRGTIRIWDIGHGSLIRELKSDYHLSGMIIVEHRDLFLIHSSGDLSKIKSEHFLPKSAMRYLLADPIKKDDWIEEALPELTCNDRLELLTKVSKDDFEARRARYKQMAANRVANLLSWVGDTENHYKRRYKLLLDRLKIRNFNVEKMKNLNRQLAIKRLKLKAGRSIKNLNLRSVFVSHQPISKKWTQHCWSDFEQENYEKLREQAIREGRDPGLIALPAKVSSATLANKRKIYKKPRTFRTISKFSCVPNSVIRQGSDIAWIDTFEKLEAKEGKSSSNLNDCKPDYLDDLADDLKDILANMGGNIKIKSINQILAEEAEAKRLTELEALEAENARLERDKLEREKLENERLAKDEAERLRLENEERAKALEQERLENERLANLENNLPDRVVPRITKTKKSAIEILEAEVLTEIDPFLKRVTGAFWFNKTFDDYELRLETIWEEVADQTFTAFTYTDDLKTVKESYKATCELFDSPDYKKLFSSEKLKDMLVDFFGQWTGNLENTDNPYIEKQKLKLMNNLIETCSAGNASSKVEIGQEIAKIMKRKKIPERMEDLNELVVDSLAKIVKDLDKSHAKEIAHVDGDLDLDWTDQEKTENAIKEILIEHPEFSQKLSGDIYSLFRKITLTKAAMNKFGELLKAKGIKEADINTWQTAFHEIAGSGANTAEAINDLQQQREILSDLQNMVSGKHLKLQFEEEEAARLKLEKAEQERLRVEEAEELARMEEEVELLRKAELAERERIAELERARREEEESSNKKKKKVRLQTMWTDAKDKVTEEVYVNTYGNDNLSYAEKLLNRRQSRCDPLPPIDPLKHDFKGEKLFQNIVDAAFYQRQLELNEKAKLRRGTSEKLSDIKIDDTEIREKHNRRASLSIYRKVSRTISSDELVSDRTRMLNAKKKVDDNDMKQRFKRMKELKEKASNRNLGKKGGKKATPEEFKAKIAQYLSSNPEKANAYRKKTKVSHFKKDAKGGQGRDELQFTPMKDLNSMNYYTDLSKGSGSHSSAKMDFFANRFNSPFGLQEHVQLTSLERMKSRSHLTIRNPTDNDFSLGFSNVAGAKRTKFPASRFRK